MIQGILEAIRFFSRLLDLYEEIKRQRGEQSLAQFYISVDQAVEASKKAQTPEEKSEATRLIVEAMGKI